MPSQGIVVSIQAKIEGWQEQIKQIQSAMKGIKVGSEVSKGLSKELQQVQAMVTSMGKNLNQRLTSETQITGFTDKVKEVEAAFNRIGTSMSNINFSDLNVDYVTSNFKDLLASIEAANTALSTGMQNSFQSAIAGSDKLQKVFAQMKLDPKNMNMDEVKNALSERATVLEKQLQSENAKVDELRRKLQDLKAEQTALKNSDILKITDPTVTSRNIIGNLSGDNILNESNIRDKINQIRQELLRLNFTEADLKKVLPKAEDLLRSGDWDKLPKLLEKHIRDAYTNATSKLNIQNQSQQQIEAQLRTAQSAAMKTSAQVYNNNRALAEIETTIAKRVAEETKPLQERVVQLERQLHQESVGKVKDIGTKVASDSAVGLQDAANAARDYSAALEQVQAREQMVGKIQGVVQRWFSIYAAVRMVGNAIRSVIATVKELDTTITEIAIVTKMDQTQLWGQMDSYTAMARKYAASISGVYKVSQLYYQQGLQQADVMALTEQTLKMARISGLDYAEATDYMTNAVRSFKMEMTDAQRVVDVYSSVAASSATNVTELATAMSKTASSAQAVGASFENTTAMMAVMIEATRESPENIGSAMKSIISRYGELKENKTGIDSEGEEYSLNKVDTALQSIGVSAHDAAGEFRNFDDVIMELAEKWDTVDKNTQRYIATVMAGNRQQSRFLALVSSYDRLKELSAEAADSEDAAQLQFLKTLDSIDAKTQQFQTSIQSLYTSSGIENFYKRILDFSNAVITSLDNLSEKSGFGMAVGKIAATFTTVATLITNLFKFLKSSISSARTQIVLESKQAALQELETQTNSAEARVQTELSVVGKVGDAYLLDVKQHAEAETEKTRSTIQQTQARIAERKKEITNLQNSLQKQQKVSKFGMAASALGIAASTIASSIDVNKNRQLKSGLTIGSSALSGLGTGLMIGATAGGPIGALIGALTALPGIIEGIGMWSESTAERIEKLETNITNAKNNKIKSQDDLKTLEDYRKKYEELSKTQYESAEKRKEFIDLQNEIAASYPQLISKMDEEGNYIINLAAGYEQLAKAKRAAYKSDLITTMTAEITGLNDIDYIVSKVYGQTLLASNKSFLGETLDDYEALLKIDYSNNNYNDEIDHIFSANENRSGFSFDSSSGATIRRLFGKNINGKDGLQLADELGLTNWWNRSEISSEGANILTWIYNDFVKFAKDGLDLYNAQLEVKKTIDPKYYELIDSFDDQFYNQLQLRWSAKEFQNVITRNSVSSYAMEYVNLLSDSMEEATDQATNAVQKRFIKEQLMTEWDKFYQDNESTLINADAETQKEMIQKFFTERQEFWYKTQLESEELVQLGEDANEFYNDFSKHSFDEIQALPEAQREFFEKLFNEDFKDTIKNYTDWLTSAEASKFNITDFSHSFGPEYLSNIQSIYSDIVSNKNLSDKQKTNQISAFNEIFKIAQGMDQDQRNTFLEKIIGADFTSLKGIYDAIDNISKIQGLDIDTSGLKKQLENLRDNINTNLNTEVETTLQAYGEVVADLSKDLDKFGKGMDFSEAQKMADKIGISFDNKNFSFKNGSWFLNDIESLEEYYKTEDTEYYNALKEKIDQRKQLYSEALSVPEFKKDTINFNLDEYVAIESEEERKALYNQWEQELLAIDKINTFNNLEKYRQYKEYWDKEHYLDTSAINSMVKDSEGYFDGTIEFNIENIIEQNNKDLKQIQKVLNEDWAASLNEAGIDVDSLISDINDYITNGDFSVSFSDWITNRLTNQLDSITTMIQSDRNYKIASTLLSNGYIKEFLEKIGLNGTDSILIQKITSGDVSNLPAELEKYAKLIYDTFNKVQSSVINSLFDALEGGSTKIQVTAENQTILQELKDQGWITGEIKEDSLVDIATEALFNSEEAFKDFINKKNLTDKQKADYLKKWHDINYPDPKEVASKMITSSKYIDWNSGRELYDSLKLINESEEVFFKRIGIEMTEEGGEITDRAAYLKALNNQIAKVQDPEERKKLRAELASAERTLTTQSKIDQKKAIEDLLKDTDKVSEEARTAFEKAIGVNNAAQYFTDNLDGTHKLNVAKLREDYADANESILELFAQLGDNAVNAIENATKLVISGTNKQADMQKMVNAFKGKYTQEQLFKYDELLDAYTLKPKYLQEFQLIQAQEYSKAMDVTYEKALAEVSKQTQKALASEIDVKGFLDAENKSGQARKEFTRQLRNAGIDGRGINGIIDTLIQGGGAAVGIIKAIAELKGEELTSADIELAYRSQVSQIEDALDQIEYGIGSIVSGKAIEILTTAGYDLATLDENNAVITGIADISAAYQAYYDMLKSSNEATLAAINEAKAKVLETQNDNFKEQTAIDALGDAAGMTYTSFAAILSTAGIELTDDIIQEFTESLGGNKMRIKDFAAFARVMNWDFDSEEYTSAFKSYNDSLIERNTQVKDQIEEEVKGLQDIKPGEWLNLTYTTKQLKNYSKQETKKAVAELKSQGFSKETVKRIKELETTDNPFYKLQTALVSFGAYIDDGILKLDDNANIVGIATTIADAAEKSGIELSSEIADMIADTINSYSEAITKGIEGGMTNAEREDLLKKAYNLGINPDELSFTETADGLELANESAIKLYQTFAQFDRTRSAKTLEQLSKRLEENNTKYKTTTGLLTHISELEDKINSGKYTDERLQALQAELEVAKQINAQRLVSGEADWNFMNNNSLPGSFTNAIEYWQGWAGAAKTLTDAGTKGEIDPSALATMFQHIYELAEFTGQPLTFMGLSTDEYSFTGLLDLLGTIVQVDAETGNAILTAEKLKELGIDLSLGAEGISQGVQDAASKFAEMNGEQLQHFHEFYENLADIADAMDGIDWNQYFNGNGEFDYNGFQQDLKKKKGALTAFENFAKNVTLDNGNLYDELKSGKTTKEVAAAMQSIFKMISSEDWDPNLGYQDIAQHLLASGFQGSIDLGDVEFKVTENHVLIRENKKGDWKDPEGNSLGTDAEAAFAEMNKRELEELKKEFDKYHQDVDNSDKTILHIPGIEYTIKVDGDHFVVLDSEGNIVGTAASANDALTSTRQAMIDQLAAQESEFQDIDMSPKERIKKETAKKKRRALESMTDEGYAEWVKSGLAATGKWKTEAKAGMHEGQITSDVRSKLLAGDYTAESLKDEARKLWEKSDLSGSQAAAEFKIKTGIDLDPSTTAESLEKIDWSEYIDQAGMTQAAADVMTGVSKAFSSESTSTAISNSIKTGVQSALSEVSTGEDGAVEVKFKSKLENIPPEEIKDEERTVTYTPKVITPEIPTLTGKILYTSEVRGGAVATGTVGAAHAKSTLMGELGPELVVSNGRYFVVGQNGPEMVDLNDDAIVFNHLQTQSLLTKGTSNTRGRAITNEYNAVAYATGSIHGGPARSSLREAANITSGGSPVWNLGFSAARKLKSVAESTEKTQKSFLAELERWFNWLQKIAHIEKEITYEEALRTKYQNDFTRTGKEYFTSQMKSLELLQDQLVVQKDLVEEQKKYLEEEKSKIEGTPYAEMYMFDERGQIEYKPGVYENFSKLFGKDKYGTPYYTGEQQYAALKAMGYEDYMVYDNSGQKIDQSKEGWQATAAQAWWDKTQEDYNKYQKLHDDIMDGEKKYIELLNEQNEIFHEIEDNQIAVEQKVLDAIEELREREIEEIRDTRTALEDGAQALTDGLNKQLDNERKMLDNQKNADELAGLQRRLAILQRSGGSAAAIADLQNQINEKQQDRYFDLQEQQIQAVQDASEAQLERLDNQIELMEQALEYEKEHGLLWMDVDQILQQSAEDIVNFIQGNTSEYWGKSTAELQKVIREDLFEVDRFKEFQGTVEGGMEALIQQFGDEEAKRRLEEKKKAEEEAAPLEVPENSSSDSGAGGGEKKTLWTYTFDGKSVWGRASQEAARREIEEKAKAIRDKGNGLSTTLLEYYNALGNKKKWEALDTLRPYAYKAGGYDYDTGLAVLHGTKDRPEAVFNAEQTRVLREQILSNRPDSVLSLLKSYRDAYHGLSNSTYDSISNNSNATTIEHAEVNLNVDKLANDYDARRAADTIMDEMLRIASKTSAKNSVRR